MKLTKYLLVAGMAFSLAACNNNDDWNTDSNVSVQLANATMKVTEHDDIFNVPLEVVGTPNGPIKVTVDLVQSATSPAEEDKHYLITSKTVVIPNDEEAQVSLEFIAVNDYEINDDRVFTINIVKVEGAKVGEIASSEVTIVDDDKVPYEGVQGTWTLAMIDNDGVTVKSKARIYGVPEGADGYGETLFMSTSFQSQPVLFELYFYNDEATNTVTIGIPYGQYIAEVVFSDLGEDPCPILYAEIVGGNSINMNGEYTGELSENRREIKFETDVQTSFLIEADGYYIWDFLYDYVLTR